MRALAGRMAGAKHLGVQQVVQRSLLGAAILLAIFKLSFRATGR